MWCFLSDNTRNKESAKVFFFALFFCLTLAFFSDMMMHSLWNYILVLFIDRFLFSFSSHFMTRTGKVLRFGKEKMEKDKETKNKLYIFSEFIKIHLEFVFNWLWITCFESFSSRENFFPREFHRENWTAKGSVLRKQGHGFVKFYYENSKTILGLWFFIWMPKDLCATVENENSVRTLKILLCHKWIFFFVFHLNNSLWDQYLK